MLEFAGRAILLDIEGTTSSVSFVYDVMFPFVRRELEGYLAKAWGDEALINACDTIARDAGHKSFADWSRDIASDSERQQLIVAEVTRLMDGDVKATGLKQIQGLIWKAGFESGEMQAHVYDDVPTAITNWTEAGLDVRIYSSGSIAAQKLFFGHTIVGDLLHFFRGHYDTTTGPKKEQASYEAIASEIGIRPADILFISDIVAELDAASAALSQPCSSVDDINRIWNGLPKSVREAAQPIALYAHQLTMLGFNEEAEKLLRKNLMRHWDDRLVRHYGEVRINNADLQLERAEGWLATREDDPELLMCLAKLAVSADDWDKARGYLLRLLDVAPSPLAYQKLAEVYEQAGDDEAAQRCHREGLRLATNAVGGLPAVVAPVPLSI